MDMEIVRPASTNERRIITSEALGISHCIVMIASYTAATLSAESQLDTLISTAIEYCIDEHPGLRTIIKDAESKYPQLALVDNIDLTRHLVYVNGLQERPGQGEEQRAKTFFEYLHDARLPRAGERPQWCVYVCRRLGAASPCFDLAFMHSHVLWDGLGSITFHETFLRALNGAKTTPAWESGPHRPERLPLPSVESAGKLTISWSYLLPILIRELLPTWLASMFGVQHEDLTDVWTGAKIRPSLQLEPGDPPTAFELALIPKQTLQRAIQACRIHGARLTGLLNYLIARALCKGLSTRGQTYRKIKVANAIDLRKALGRGQGALANYVSFLGETIAFQDDECVEDSITEKAWDTIKRSTLRLAEASNTLVDQPVALIKYISDVKPWLLGQAAQHATVSFGLSNLGVFGGAPSHAGSQDDWRIGTAVISQSGSKTGAPLNFQLLSTRDGCMGITATWWPGMLGLNDEQEFVSELLHEMEQSMEKIR